MFFWGLLFLWFFFPLYTDLIQSTVVLKQQIMSFATAPLIWKTEDKGEFAGDSPLSDL